MDLRRRTNELRLSLERTPRLRISTAALVLANLVPLIGVVVFGWDVFYILFLFWAENVVVGFFNVLRMAVASFPGKLVAIPFFIVHYGIFTLCHGIFVVSMFGSKSLSELTASGGVETEATLQQATLAGVGTPSFLVALVVLFVSHAVSFVVNTIGGREYETVSLETLMFRPYHRIVVLHLTILLGGGLVVFFGSPVAAIALLVLLKTVIDVRAHLKEHAPPMEP